MVGAREEWIKSSTLFDSTRAHAEALFHILLTIQIRKLRPVLDDALTGIQTPALNLQFSSFTFPLPVAPVAMTQRHRREMEVSQSHKADCKAVGHSHSCLWAGLAHSHRTGRGHGHEIPASSGLVGPGCSGPHGTLRHRVWVLGLPIGLWSPLLPQSNKGPNPPASRPEEPLHPFKGKSGLQRIYSLRTVSLIFHTRQLMFVSMDDGHILHW